LSETESHKSIRLRASLKGKWFTGPGGVVFGIRSSQAAATPADSLVEENGLELVDLGTLK